MEMHIIGTFVKVTFETRKNILHRIMHMNYWLDQLIQVRIFVSKT